MKVSMNLVDPDGVVLVNTEDITANWPDGEPLHILARAILPVEGRIAFLQLLIGDVVLVDGPVEEWTKVFRGSMATIPWSIDVANLCVRPLI